MIDSRHSPDAVQTAEHAATDEELFLRYREEGDREAFDQLVHRYEGELYRYLSHYLRDATLAEDIFQATFLRIYQRPGQYDPSMSLRPWLYSIATHLAIDAQRRAGTRRAASLSQQTSGADETGRLSDMIATPESGPVAEAEELERDALVREAVDALPEHLRTALILVYFQGLKYREAANVLDVPEGTLKSRIHSALRQLTPALERQRSPERTKAPRGGRAHRPSRTRKTKEPAAAGSASNPRSELKEKLAHLGESDGGRPPERLADGTCRRIQSECA